VTRQPGDRGRDEKCRLDGRPKRALREYLVPERRHCGSTADNNSAEYLRSTIRDRQRRLRNNVRPLDLHRNRKQCIVPGVAACAKDQDPKIQRHSAQADQTGEEKAGAAKGLKNSTYMMPVPKTAAKASFFRPPTRNLTIIGKGRINIKISATHENIPRAIGGQRSLARRRKCRSPQDSPL
jgi:hypothetical protein